MAVMDGILIKLSAGMAKSFSCAVTLTCIFINHVCTLHMSSDCLDAGLVGAELLEERVIGLKIQHACALPVGQR